MFALYRPGAGNVLGVKASGQLTHADYERLVLRLEELIKEQRKIRVLVELEDCQGWDIGAAWDEVKFWFKHGADVERCAVVGQKKWQEWLTKLTRPFLKGKYFDKGKLDQAWQWILEGSRTGPVKK